MASHNSAEKRNAGKHIIDLMKRIYPLPHPKSCYSKLILKPFSTGARFAIGIHLGHSLLQKEEMYKEIILYY